MFLMKYIMSLLWYVRICLDFGKFKIGLGKLIGNGIYF